MTKIIELDYEFQPESRYGYGKPLHPELYEIINRQRSRFVDFLQGLKRFSANFGLIPTAEDSSNPAVPFWGNLWFPGLDAMSLYGMLATRKPKRYFEVGSGNSTKFARRAILDHSLATRLISLDPEPRAEIDALCDESIRFGFEFADLRIFDQLESGDILFIDNSHRAFTNSDVTVFFLEVLPRLKRGVLVHLHDIMLPADYPPEWANRYYSEQYLLACYLLAGWPRLKILLANGFISIEPELMALATKVYDESGITEFRYGGASFWIEMQ